MAITDLIPWRKKMRAVYPLNAGRRRMQLSRSRGRSSPPAGLEICGCVVNLPGAIWGPGLEVS
jgi:hypothetical protein